MLCYVMLCYDEYTNTNTNMSTNMNMMRMRMRINDRYTLLQKMAFS